MDRNFWLAFGAAAFAAGFVAIAAMRRRRTEGERRRPPAMRLKTRDEENHKLIHAFVVLTAGTAYLVMASGGGRVRMPDGHELFYMRYIDWAITTPLLLLSLGLTALGTPFRRWGLLLGVMGVDLYMIVTGFFSDASPHGSMMKWLWYGISSGAFLGVYYMLWGPLREESRLTGEKSADLYFRHTAFLSAVWALYPLNFLLGPEGLDIIDTDTSTGGYTVLDITAKVLFGLYSLSDVQERATGDLDDGNVPEHELRPAPRAHHEVWEAGPPIREASPAAA